MANYRRNHYVPEWYQYRFLPEAEKECKFFYLDLKPEIKTSNGRQYTRKSLLYWGPPKCFCQTDLYTTQLGDWESTEIEQKFFGKVDTAGSAAVDYFSKFEHLDVNTEAVQDLLRYMSIQKLRTPKGLAYLSHIARTQDKNTILFKLQELQNMFCALWTECVWQIADAKNSETKFIVSDHPVTVYNKACFPASHWCTGFKDPDIWLSGTHTLFPLSEEKILIFTNLSWVRYPYGNPTKPRPHPSLFRSAMFNFTDIQTRRSLSEAEVNKINYIIKMRAYRYLAARRKQWLFPEQFLTKRMWNNFGDNYLLMPDPRSVSFSTETIIGYKDGRFEAFDEYGRRPWQSHYNNNKPPGREFETLLAFQGEFARLFGPRRRGRNFEFEKLCDEEDNPDFHAYHLSLEGKNKKHRYK